MTSQHLPVAPAAPLPTELKPGSAGNPTHRLNRLELGFRTDSARLLELEQTLNLTIHSARLFGNRQGTPNEQERLWHRQWDDVTGILGQIRRLVVQIESALAGTAPDRRETALRLWQEAQVQDGELLAALSKIRTRAGTLDQATRKDWNRLAHRLEDQLESIHACAQALRVKIELRSTFPEPAADALFRSLLPAWPAGPGDEPAFDRDYRQAANELDREHHAFAGLWDVIKGLSLWVESPDERMRRNRSLTVDEY
jgi:hypothetical protein